MGAPQPPKVAESFVVPEAIAVETDGPEVVEARIAALRDYATELRALVGLISFPASAAAVGPPTGAPSAEDAAAIEKLAGELSQHSTALEQCDPPLRLEIARGLLGLLAPFGAQETPAHIYLLLGESAWAAGDSRLALALLGSYAQRFPFGAEPAAAMDYPRMASVEWWARSVRAQARLIDVGVAAGDFSVAMQAMRTGMDLVARFESELPGAPALERDMRAADLYVSASDVFRALGRIEDADERIGDAMRALGPHTAQPASAALVAPLLERARLAALELKMLRGDHASAIAVCDELLESQVARGASAADLGDTLVRRAFAESGLARRLDTGPAKVRQSLERALALPKLYPATARLAWLKMLEMCLWGDDLAGAKRCVERGGALFDGALDPRSAEFAVLRAQQEKAVDSVPRAAIEAALGGHLRELQAQWHSQAPRRGGIGFMLQPWRRAIVSEWVDTVLDPASRSDGGNGDGAASRALQGMVDLQHDSTLARVRGATGVTVGDAQRELVGADGALLVFLPSRFRSHLFVVRRDGVRHHPLPREVELGAVLGAYTALLTTHPAAVPEDFEARWRILGDELVQQLLPEPLRTELASLSTVTIVGAELLEGLPFESLPLGEDLMGEALAIDYLDSIPFGVATARLAEPLARRIALLACTAPKVGGVDFEPMAFEPAWWAPVLEACSGTAALEKDSDAAVTVERVLEALRPEVGVLHLVGHGTRRWDHELSNGIALADAVLWPDRLAGHPFEGLVILSSCSAARGEIRRGDGNLLTNLGGAFLWEGARAVVLPLAPIPVAPHLRFMGAVHERLQAGLSPAAALQRARLEMRAADPAMPGRVFRALVQVHGLGQRPLW